MATDSNTKDERFCEQLLCGLEVGPVEEDIHKVLRLGKDKMLQLHIGQFQFSWQAAVPKT